MEKILKFQMLDCRFKYMLSVITSSSFFYLKTFHSSDLKIITITTYGNKTDQNSNRMYLEWSLCTLYLLAWQVRVTVGDSGLCCFVRVTCVQRYDDHSPLFVQP